MTISMEKKYRYRNGEPARVLCTDSPHPSRPVVSLGLEDGRLLTHFPNGWFWGWDSLDGHDLIEVKPRIKTEVWLNIYREVSFGYDTKALADAGASQVRIACVEVPLDYEEGEGIQ